MKKRQRWFIAIFAFVGGLGVLFVVLPLVTTVLATRPVDLWKTFIDPEVAKSISTTFLAGAIATGIGLVLGIPLAYVLARYRFPAKGLVEGIVALPVVIPHTAAGIALLMVFGSKGLLGGLFQRFGVFFVDRLAGVVVAMLFVGMPFLITASREAFAAVDVEMEKVAMIDGANSWQAFLYVTLPQAWRGITAGAMMMWARGISEFGAVAILAYHPKVVPVLIFERFQGYGLTAARPIAVILILAVLAVFTGIRLLAVLKQNGEKKNSSSS